MYRFRYLLTSLVLLIVIQPWVRGPVSRTLYLAVFSALVISAVWSVRADRRIVVAEVLLAALSLAGTWIGVLIEGLAFHLASRTVTVAFMVLVMWALLRDIARQTRVQPETIYQAACVYLILGVVFAVAYSSISQLDPAAFSPLAAHGAPALGPRTGTGAVDLHGWIYFSFVTLTTLGYGDVVAVAPAARTLVILEALLGQFFVAVLVGRLVGLLHVRPDSDRVDLGPQPPAKEP